MSLRMILRDFVQVVSDEAERNPTFAERLRIVFGSTTMRPSGKRRSATSRRGSKVTRSANRRPPAILDPLALAAQGEESLRTKLTPLTLDQLKDIVADYGMDRDRLVMKWRTPNRVIDRIVEVSISRAHKGDAFRS